MRSVALGRQLAAPRWPTMVVDVVIAGAALVGSLALREHATVSAVGPHGPDVLAVMFIGAATVPLLWWRRGALGVFLTTATAGTVLATLGSRLDLVPGPAAALFLLAASQPRSTLQISRRSTGVVVMFGLYVVTTAIARGEVPVMEIFHSGLAWAVAWFAGDRTRLRREQVAALNERLAHAEGDRDRERLLARAEERARIARDLHDSAGHAINVIAVQAGAARLRHTGGPDPSLAALKAIEELARTTADEVDQIVDVLRENRPNDSVIESPTGLASLDTLVAQWAAAGLVITSEVSGTPRPLGAPVDQAAYRILQEALTNAARHGAGSAHIQQRFGETAVELCVTNPVDSASASAAAAGHGLIGMRERATLLGGWFTPERRDDTYVIQACLPYGNHRT